MVGIVIVSHSKSLADAVLKLAEQAVKEAPVVGVGGVGESFQDFGTDAVAIMEAITHVYSDDGVLVLMDMGSALLSARTALELLEYDIASRVEMCSAPLVEGTIVAAVQSSIGADITTVKTEALNALHPKQEQIGDAAIDDINDAVFKEDFRNNIPKDAKQSTFVIQNEHGLHARPASTFVLASSKYDVHAYVGLEHSAKTLASVRSLNSIAKLNIQKGDTITVYVWGKDTQAFLEELETLVLSEFGEKQIHEKNRGVIEQKTEFFCPASEIAIAEDTPQKLLSISQGIVIGVVWKIDSQIQPKFLITQTNSPDVEVNTLDTLLATAEKKLDEDIVVQKEPTTRKILEMHKVMLLDPDLYQKTKDIITQKHCTAAYAWYLVCKQSANEYKALKDNDYLQARADDIMDIAIRLIRESDTVMLPIISATPDNAVLFIDEVTPDIITNINLDKVKGIVTKTGGNTSHAAIISRAQNIPMMSGFQDIEKIQTHTPVIVDTQATKVIVNPTKDIVLFYEEKCREISKLRKHICADVGEHAYTRDKIQIDCGVNIGSKQDIDTLTDVGVEGVGLFRSEFLFFNRNAPPSEEEQYEVYKHVAKVFSNKSVVVRLLDIGGDKQISYLRLPKENNPFLGVRGVRFDLKYTQILMPQLRALLRAAVHGDIKIMLPMVVDIQEIREIREKIEQAKHALSMENHVHVHNISLGIMIETPASVMISQELAKESDFFSIGTNDLTQYILAVERDSTSLSNMYDVCHPAVLYAIKQVIHGAQDINIPVSVCGEASSDFEAVPIFLGMGIKKLSANASCIPAIKYLTRNLCHKDCEEMVHHIWTLSSAKDVRAYVRERIPVVESLSSIF